MALKHCKFFNWVYIYIPNQEEKHQWTCGCPLWWQSSSAKLPICSVETPPMSNPQNLRSQHEQKVVTRVCRRNCCQKTKKKKIHKNWYFREQRIMSKADILKKIYDWQLEWKASPSGWWIWWVSASPWISRFRASFPLLSHTSSHNLFPKKKTYISIIKF